MYRLLCLEIKQIVQYFFPHHHAKLTQVQLLVIDEAAVIPIFILKRMLGPYMVILCSSVNGYEGTGRSLPLKNPEAPRAANFIYPIYVTFIKRSQNV